MILTAIFRLCIITYSQPPAKPRRYYSDHPKSRWLFLPISEKIRAFSTMSKPVFSSEGFAQPEVGTKFFSLSSCSHILTLFLDPKSSNTLFPPFLSFCCLCKRNVSSISTQNVILEAYIISLRSHLPWPLNAHRLWSLGGRRGAKILQEWNEGIHAEGENDYAVCSSAPSSYYQTIHPRNATMELC